MKEIFEQYGGAIITGIAVASLAIMIKTVIGTGNSGPVFEAFNSLLTNMKGIFTN